MKLNTLILGEKHHAVCKVKSFTYFCFFYGEVDLFQMAKGSNLPVMLVYNENFHKGNKVFGKHFLYPIMQNMRHIWNST